MGKVPRRNSQSEGEAHQHRNALDGWICVRANLRLVSAQACDSEILCSVVSFPKLVPDSKYSKLDWSFTSVRSKISSNTSSKSCKMRDPKIVSNFQNCGFRPRKSTHCFPFMRVFLSSCVHHQNFHMPFYKRIHWISCHSWSIIYPIVSSYLINLRIILKLKSTILTIESTFFTFDPPWTNEIDVLKFLPWSSWKNAIPFLLWLVIKFS